MRANPSTFSIAMYFFQFTQLLSNSTLILQITCVILNISNKKARNKLMKKLLHLTSIFLCTFVLCFCVSPQAASANSGGTTTVSISVQYGQTEARDMLQMINAFRTNLNEAWAWNESNTQRLTYAGLSPMQYDYELERIAMLRAAEIAISFSHTRPNGTNCFTAFGNSNAYVNKGENIASGYSTASSAFEGWKETNEYYANQGHRRNMLSDSYNAIGIGHVFYNGTHYWVQEFGTTSSPNTAATAPNNNREMVNIESLSTFTPGNSTGSGNWNNNNYREYYVTFYANYGVMNENSRQYTTNQRLASLPYVSRNGYTFKGWYTQPTGGYMITTSTIFYADTAVYAQWEPYQSVFSNFSVTDVTANAATITATLPLRFIRSYGINYGTSNTYLPVNRIVDCYTSTSAITLPVTGLKPDTIYYFKLYYISENSERIESTVGSFTTKKASEYTVTFYPNGGTIEGLSSMTTTNQRLTSLPSARQDNYKFEGWYTAANGGSMITTSTDFRSDMSVFAHWTYQPAVNPPVNPPVTDTNTGNSGSTNTGSTDVSEPDDIDEAPSVEKTKLKNLKNTGKGKLKVYWKWNPYGDGYQIAYSTNKYFPSSKTKRISAGVFTDSKTITGLKKGTTYYVRVRAYQKVSGEKFYGPWSNVKKIKLKK